MERLGLTSHAGESSCGVDLERISKNLRQLERCKGWRAKKKKGKKKNNAFRKGKHGQLWVVFFCFVFGGVNV